MPGPYAASNGVIAATTTGGRAACGPPTARSGRTPSTIGESDVSTSGARASGPAFVARTASATAGSPAGKQGRGCSNGCRGTGSARSARGLHGWAPLSSKESAARSGASPRGSGMAESRETFREGDAGYLASSVARDSRMTVTLICPGYSSSCSISRAISCERRTAASSSISPGLTITRTSRPAWSA